MMSRVAAAPTGPAHNAWAGLGAFQETAFTMLKVIRSLTNYFFPDVYWQQEDVIRYLPSTPASLEIAATKKIVIALV